jgi:hypothetical protein
MADYTKQMTDKRDEFKNVMQQAFDAKYGTLEVGPSTQPTGRWEKPKNIPTVSQQPKLNGKF